MADDGLIKRLRKQIATTERRTGPAPEGAGDKVFDYLNRQLGSYDLEGQVVSVLTRNDSGVISCYGQRIPEDNIFLALRVSIGARGPAVSSPPGTPSEDFVSHEPLAQTISYKGIHRLTSFKEGFLVPLTGPDQKYAALINTKVDFNDPDVVAYQFPRSS
jgi:hypothetical protein